MPTFEEGAAFTHAIPPEHPKQAFYKPTAEEAAKAKALINFMMQDRFFLALYRSNDPKVRAAAVDKLNKAHHQAYGDAPTKDDNDVAGRKKRCLFHSCSPVPRRKVMTDNPFEIPQHMRDLAEQNMKQAHASYEQLTDFVAKAMDARIGAMPSPMAAGLKDVQDRAVDFAKENAGSAFTLAEKITKAQNFQEVSRLQTQFAQDWMQAFVTQTQQLCSLIEDAFQKSKRGTMGAEMSAMPASSMAAGSKDVQDRAVEIAKKNAQSESALALVEKIAKAQNLQEIVTLQTRFAQEQMQACATQMQELQGLIGETVQKLQRR